MLSRRCFWLSRRIHASCSNAIKNLLEALDSSIAKQLRLWSMDEQAPDATPADPRRWAYHFRENASGGLGSNEKCETMCEHQSHPLSRV
jgi:hypothetical protein